ncbi:hypothetical protein Salat_0071500 [Sesamum alatum]|uniref:Uncharacterized protein n=1 Tax=Sesamum alatum TaxID=300844 RepID=A0AAE2CWN4_9LAMI|nr:hypothetical protein Salat_0071500 [Sesamum alatum]
MDSYYREEFSVSEVADKIVTLFGEHRDLAAGFRSFLPESCVQEGSRKRKSITPGGNIDKEIRQNQESINHDETETPAAAAKDSAANQKLRPQSGRRESRASTKKPAEDHQQR